MQDINPDELRAQAVGTLKKRAELRSHLTVYVVFNTMLIVIWAVMGHNFFWPIFPLLGWGVGIVLHAVDVYTHGPTAAQIRRQMSKLR